MRILVITLAFTFAFGVLGSLHGCGLKGPLHLPEAAQAVEPAPPATTQPANQDSEQDEEKKKTSPTAPATTP